MKLKHKAFLLMQDIFIKATSFVTPSIMHNIEKHNVLKKFLFYKEIEGIEGDYLEFGVYEGTSIKGAAIYWRNIGSKPIKFYGFDSFKGMKPEVGDEHPFYTKFDFSTEFKEIKKRFLNIPEIKLVPGFFQDTLKKDPNEYGINKAGIIMMDCDLYSSSKIAFNFIKRIVIEGTILILDDYFGYKGNKNKGVRAAFQEFIKENNVVCEQISQYGIGGAVFIITKIRGKRVQ